MTPCPAYALGLLAQLQGDTIMANDPKPVDETVKTYIVIHPVWTGNYSYTVMYGQTVVHVSGNYRTGKFTVTITHPPKIDESLKLGQVALAAATTTMQLSALTDNH